jgi:hypothetical protein
MGKPLPALEVEKPGPVIPDRLLTCYVEEWCDPGSDPIPSWHGDIRPGTKDWIWFWQIEARRRQRDARAMYLAEHGLTEPPWSYKAPRWRREPEVRRSNRVR